MPIQTRRKTKPKPKTKMSTEQSLTGEEKTKQSSPIPSTAQSSTQQSESNAVSSSVQSNSQQENPLAVISTATTGTTQQSESSAAILTSSKGDDGEGLPPPDFPERESNKSTSSSRGSSSQDDNSQLELDKSKKKIDNNPRESVKASTLLGDINSHEDFLSENEEQTENEESFTYLIDKFGDDEFPKLAIQFFDDKEFSMSEFEQKNQKIYNDIITLVDSLYLRKARHRHQMIRTLRVRRPREMTETHFHHEGSCEESLEEIESGDVQTRAILFMADFDGINPLLGSFVEHLVKLTGAFIRQDKFFAKEDCCHNFWLSTAATRALQILRELLEDTLTNEVHKRNFWRYLPWQDRHYLEEREWDKIFKVPETKQEREERQREKEKKDQIETLERKRRELEWQEEKLKKVAEETAELIKRREHARPPELLTSVEHFLNDGKAEIYDHKTKKILPLKTVLDRVSRGFQNRLFKDQMRQQIKKEEAEILAQPGPKNFVGGILQTPTSLFKKRKAPPKPRVEEIKEEEIEEQDPGDFFEDDFANVNSFDEEPEPPVSPIVASNDDKPWNVSLVKGKSETNVLVHMAEIPKTESFDPAIGSKSYTDVMNFVRKCEDTEQDLRIANWPKELKSAINMQYRYTFEIYDKTDGSKNTDWQKLGASELRLVLQRMREAATGKSSSSSNLLETFRTWLSQTKIHIDWGYTGNPMSHPFLVNMNEVLNRFDSLKSQLDTPLNKSDETLLVKVLAKEIVHENISKEGRATMKTLLDGKLNELKDFEDALQVISDAVMKQLKVLYDASTFRITSQGSTASGKRKEGSSSSNNTPSSKKPKTNPKSNDKKDSASGQKPRCKGCGWDMRQQDGEGPRRCPRNDFEGCKEDPRRNTSNKQWVDSEVGKKWMKYSKKGLPKDPTITLKNVKERSAAFNSGEHLSINQYCAHLLESSDLINFSIVNSQEKAKVMPKRASVKRLREKAPMLSGRLLLDTGAIGNSVVSSTFYNDMIRLNQSHEMFKANSSLTSAFNDSTEINKEVFFKVNVITKTNKLRS